MDKGKVNYSRVGLAVAVILIVAAYFRGPGMVQKREMDKGEDWLRENKTIIADIIKGTEIKVEITTRKDILIMGEVRNEEQKVAVGRSGDPGFWFGHGPAAPVRSNPSARERPGAGRVCVMTGAPFRRSAARPATWRAGACGPGSARPCRALDR